MVRGFCSSLNCNYFFLVALSLLYVPLLMSMHCVQWSFMVHINLKIPSSCYYELLKLFVHLNWLMRKIVREMNKKADGLKLHESIATLFLRTFFHFFFCFFIRWNSINVLEVFPCFMLFSFLGFFMLGLIFFITFFWVINSNKSLLILRLDDVELFDVFLFGKPFFFMSAIIDGFN